MKVTPEFHSIAKGINMLMNMTAKLQLSKAKQALDHKNLVTKMLSQSAALFCVKSKMQFLEDKYQYLKRKLSVFQTPEEKLDRKRRPFIQLLSTNDRDIAESFINCMLLPKNKSISYSLEAATVNCVQLLFNNGVNLSDNGIKSIQVSINSSFSTVANTQQNETVKVNNDGSMIKHKIYGNDLFDNNSNKKLNKSTPPPVCCLTKKNNC